MIFHDYTQLKKLSQRRLTATWQERRGDSVTMVPSTAKETADDIDPWDLEGSAEHWTKHLRNPPQDWPDWKPMVGRIALWWIRQWKDPGGLYRLVRPNPNQRTLADELLRTIPRNFFTCHPSDVERNPDTHLVCETLAVGGQLLVTRNRGTIRRELVNPWVEANRERYGFATTRLLIDSDRWLIEALGELKTPESREELAKTALAAFWPHRTAASQNEVLAEVLTLTKNLRLSPFGQTLRAAEGIIIEEMEAPGTRIGEWVEETRQTLPIKMRTAEQEHPRFPSQTGIGT